MSNPKTFPIYHDEHGEATCDDRMFAEFEGHGWSKEKPKAKSKKDDKPDESAKPTKSKKGEKPSDSSADNGDEQGQVSDQQ